ncbi:hypothetical protein AB0M02_23560 [Actinoplanes sp. NPDC051861]|uniref:hypothetical protein n=1 Tax=Actinoplanes sp. NPDC051861 TaxID=3155170 RepID=UPI00341E71D6
MSAENAGRRVEELLAEARAGGDPRTAVLAEELTGCLVRLYGEGLARIVAALGPERVAELCADPLVESLLLVHDLHPLDGETRLRRAVERAGAYARIRRLEIDGAGVAHLDLEIPPGCGGTREALRAEIETAVHAAAPELSGVEITMAVAPPLLQVSMRPGLD